MDKRWVKFPEVLFFQEGPGVRNTQYTSEGVKLLNVANLVNGKVDISNSDRFISRDEAYGKYKHFLCDNGDFIVASSGIKVEYIDKKMGFIDKSMLPLCMNTSTVRFKVLNSKELNIRYFMYYLKSRHFKLQLAKQITGSAQLNYGPSHLKDMCLPIVDIYIQNNIVEILDKIQSMINICEAKIEKLDILVRARFVEMFGDLKNTIRLGDCCKVHARIGWQALTRDEHMKTGEYMLVTGTDFIDGKINYNTCVYVTKERYEMDPHIILRDNDILITKDGSIGKVAIIHNLSKPATLNSGVFVVRPKDIFNKEYISGVFRGPLFEKFIELSKTGATIKHLNQKHLVEFRIPLPTLEKQEVFAGFSNQVNKSKVEVKRALDKAQLLFDSLMQKYFG